MSASRRCANHRRARKDSLQRPGEAGDFVRELVAIRASAGPSVTAVTQLAGGSRHGPALAHETAYVQRIYIVLTLAAAIAFPAAAFARGTSAGSGQAGPSVGPGRAIAISAISPAVGRFRHSIEVARRRIAVERRARLRRERREAFAALPGGVSMSTLESIAACESGGDPTAVSSDGAIGANTSSTTAPGNRSVAVATRRPPPRRSRTTARRCLLRSPARSPWPICG